MSWKNEKRKLEFEFRLSVGKRKTKMEVLIPFSKDVGSRRKTVVA